MYIYMSHPQLSVAVTLSRTSGDRTY